MKIITAPHQVLRQKAKQVAVFDKKFFVFLRQLADTLIKKEQPSGVGLAAPQVGKSISVFAAILGETNQTSQNPRIEFFINPIITKTSKKKIKGLINGEDRFEGCLSVPLFYGPVPRHEWIEISYQSITVQDLLQHQFTLKSKKARFSDFDARVIQHEYDHLQGILFTDHILANNLPIYVEKDGQWVKVKNQQEILSLL
jgi:peptide deformylase